MIYIEGAYNKEPARLDRKEKKGGNRQRNRDGRVTITGHIDVCMFAP